MAQQSLPRLPRQIGARKTYAVVASMYNETYINALLESTKAELLGLAPAASVPLYRVPGAWEIPVCAEYVLQHTNADALICLGVIIQGETGHADLIARSVTDELQRMATRHLIPIINMVLLVGSEEEAHARCMGEELNRGVEAARTALNMSELFAKLHTAYPLPKSKQADE